jgi:hypothetical protein
MNDQVAPSSAPPRRLKKHEAREALPVELRETFDELCKETLFWSQYYYGSSLISYSIIKELVETGWKKAPASVAQQRQAGPGD